MTYFSKVSLAFSTTIFVLVSFSCKPRQFNNNVKNTNIGVDARLGGLDGWNETIIVAKTIEGLAIPPLKRTKEQFGCFYYSTMKVRTKERLNDSVEEKFRRHFRPNFGEKIFSGARGLRNVLDAESLKNILDLNFSPNDMRRQLITVNSRPFAVNLNLLNKEIDRIKTGALINQAKDNYQNDSKNKELINSIKADLFITAFVAGISLIPGLSGLIIVSGAAAAAGAATAGASTVHTVKNSVINFQQNNIIKSIESASKVSKNNGDNPNNNDAIHMTEGDIPKETVLDEKNTNNTEYISGLGAVKNLKYAVSLMHQLDINTAFKNRERFKTKMQQDSMTSGETEQVMVKALDGESGLCPLPSEIFPLQKPE
jgi:hypothetical protein